MRWLPWVLLAACSTGSTGAARPPARPADPSPPAAQALPSERECDELITRAVLLGIDERAPGGAGNSAPRQGSAPSARPSEPRSTEADHEAVRRKLHEDFMAGCRQLPHATLRCAMAATTLTAMAACQSTRSSSTSNSSVAPGGITPPAPRSP